ncbi:MULTISPECIES: AAA family ATPase [unclassified Brevundimonas]|uniref:AAA family ATPase n=1 Tax=unclassified Brevundimonas TaxID=2622653 RepID=UPI0025C1B87B|nr:MULTISPECIES: AAA family ATPase [unclassified Brevundimonas]
MRLDALRLFNVKRFDGHGVSIEGLSDGVNVLAAPNEFGKSTSFEALTALFFAKHSSRSADVMSLRPYSGGSPRVEADITTAKGRYRITKQFLGKAVAQVVDLDSGRLIAQADEAEGFIGELLGDATSGPAALLWVKQGVTGWERRTKAEDENETTARTDLLHSVQGEVEAITGGRRMAEIQSATEAALKELVTATGRPKVGGRYHAALDKRDRLRSEIEKLGADVDALRVALDQRASQNRRLKELNSPEEVAARDAALATAQSQFEAAKSRHEVLERLKAELKLALTNRDAAQRELDQFQSALEAYATVTQELKTLEPLLVEATRHREEAKDAEHRAREAASAAEKAEADARSALEKHDLFQRATEAAKRLQTLKDSLDKALSSRTAIESLRADLSAKTVPDSALAELQELENTLLKLRTIRDNARPSVIVEYDSGASHRILMDGVALEPSQERHYSGRTALTAPGIGTIQLRSNSVDDAAELAACEEKHRQLLTALGVESLAAARLRQDQARDIMGRIETETARLGALAPDGIEALQQEVSACELAARDVPEDLPECDVLEAAFQAAKTHRHTCIEAQKTSSLALDSATNRYVEISTRHSPLDSRFRQMGEQLGAPDEHPARLAQLKAALLAEQARVEEAEAKVREAESSATDFEFAQANLQRAQSVKSAAEKESNQLQVEIASHNALIKARSDEAVEEKINERREELEAAEQGVGAFEHEIAILQRLLSALESARQEAKDLYLAPVMEELRPLLSMLFEDVAITFDDQALLPESLIRKGQDEAVDKLSGGMREQLSILTRLAFARLLARDNRPIPVVLDDALVYSDDDRIEHMFNALHRQAKDQQVIVLTCRQRAFQKLGGHVLKLQSWEP